MKKSKKLAALVLAMVMALSLMAVTAAAYGAEKSDAQITGVPLRRRSGICKRTREPLNKGRHLRRRTSSAQEPRPEQVGIGIIRLSQQDISRSDLEKGAVPPYQAGESFRPALASRYKLAQANMAYKRFSFFRSPRYTVFL